MQNPVDLSIVLLAKNEAENLRVLLPKIKSSLKNLGLVYEIIIVVSGSDDETFELSQELACKFLIQSKPGFGIALSEGIQSSSGRRILTLDADLQHDPKLIPEMLNIDSDLVIGSRWIRKQQIDLPLYRIILSLGLNIMFSNFLGIPVRDMSSNFRLYRRKVFKGMKIEGTNFDALQEVLIKIIVRGFDVVEIPMNFRERKVGTSNVRLSIFIMSYFKTFLKALRLKLLYKFMN